MRLVPTADPWHRYPQATSARVLASLFNVAVGLRLVMPDDILGDPRNHSYELMQRHFFGDVPLGLALLLFGTLMVAGLYTYRADRVVDVAHWLSFLTWLLVVFDITAANPSQIGTLVYLLVAALNAYAYAHLRAWRAQQQRQAAKDAE